MTFNKDDSQLLFKTEPSTTISQCDGTIKVQDLYSFDSYK